MKKFFFSVLIFFGFILLILSLISGYFFLRYKSWEKEFGSEIKAKYLIEKEILMNQEFNEKIAEFSLSIEDTQYLEFEVQEIGGIIFSVLESYLGDNFKIEEMYIEPSNSKWVLYAKVKYQNFIIWVSTDVNKDEVMGPQVYITDIKVGPFSVSSFDSNIVNTINTGIGDSIVTLNENGLVGRYIENIELTEESVILKGSRY